MKYIEHLTQPCRGRVPADVLRSAGSRVTDVITITGTAVDAPMA